MTTWTIINPSSATWLPYVAFPPRILRTNVYAKAMYGKSLYGKSTAGESWISLPVTPTTPIWVETNPNQ